MPQDDDLLTLAREDLYELVWSKPMRELAEDFGLSDVGLAKRCRKLGVPVPGRGYWARFAAGQKPHRPKLRKRADKPADYNALTFGPPPEDPPAPAVPEPDKIATLRQQLESLPTGENEDLHSATSPVKRTALKLKRPWRKEIQWNRGERKGPIVDIEVDEASVDRALLVAEKLIATTAALNNRIRWADGTYNSPAFHGDMDAPDKDALSSVCVPEHIRSDNGPEMVPRSDRVNARQSEPNSTST